MLEISEIFKMAFAESAPTLAVEHQKSDWEIAFLIRPLVNLHLFHLKTAVAVYRYHIILPILKNQRMRVYPVSYTHLDVYKRQSLTCANVSIFNNTSLACGSSSSYFCWINR